MVFSACLTLLSAGILTSAAVSTNSALEPFQMGMDWAAESGLSRSTNALTVIVSTYDAGRIERVQDATVNVERLGRGGAHSEEPVASGVTGVDGRIRFELAPGHRFGGGYFVNVTHGGVSDIEGTQLEEDVRLGVYFTPAGTAHWRVISHEDLRDRGGDVAQLGARMTDERGCTEHPGGGRGCEGIAKNSLRVVVERLEDGRPVEKVHDQTGPKHGQAEDVHLPPGDYAMTVYYDGKQRTENLLLLCDLYVFFTYDGASIGLERPMGCMKTPVGVED